MKYTDNDLRNEIRGCLAGMVSYGHEIVPDWVAIKIIDSHMPGFKREPDFVANAVWGHVRRHVGAETRNYRQEEEETNQAVLPGFELLQEYYECKRVDGANAVVLRIHREKMTLKELREQANALIDTGNSLKNHGNQLHRWADMRVAEGFLEDDEE